MKYFKKFMENKFKYNFMLVQLYVSVYIYKHIYTYTHIFWFILFI